MVKKVTQESSKSCVSVLDYLDYYLITRAIPGPDSQMLVGKGIGDVCAVLTAFVKIPAAELGE